MALMFIVPVPDGYVKPIFDSGILNVYYVNKKCGHITAFLLTNRIH